MSEQIKDGPEQLPVQCLWGPPYGPGPWETRRSPFEAVRIMKGAQDVTAGESQGSVKAKERQLF